MRHSFSWKLHKSVAEEYCNNMGVPPKFKKKETDFEISIKKEKDSYKILLNSETLKKLNSVPKNIEAYKIAVDTRKFEIDKYWQRTLYFWGMITATYVAYFHVLAYLKKLHGSISLIVLSGLGLFFCFSWFLASKGSKHWQENWEHHIDMLEDDITGPLFKTYQAGTSYSVSKINIMAGWILTFCSFGLFIFEIVEFAKRTLNLYGSAILPYLFLIVLSTIFELLAYSQIVKGNTGKSGEIEFDIKQYDNLNKT